ncbi:MAG: NAD(P)-dependent oxidoreductase [Thermoleophilia bacterium]
MGSVAESTQLCSEIVVTFPLAADERVLLARAVGGRPLTFLEDLADEARRAALQGAEVVISWNVRREVRDEEWSLLGRLRLLQLVSAGADHLPFAHIPVPAIIAANVGAYAEPMAEHALALALALAKRLCLENGELKAGRFNQSTPNRELRGETCVILGFGGIGQATARLARALGMRIVAVNRTGVTAEPVDAVGTLADLDPVLRAATVVVMALPLTRATRGLIGRRELEWMATDAILVNVARAAIIDEDALYEHLLTHPGFMAGLDAWWIEPFSQDQFRLDHAFLDLPNVLGSPHNSAIVPGSLTEGVRRAGENVARYLAGAPVSGVVDRNDYTV